MNLKNKEKVMLALCFKNLVLGRLDFKNGEFYYTSNLVGENQFKQKYPLGAVYDMFESDHKKLDTLPLFLRGFLDCAQSEFYKSRANIGDDFDDFQKLVALSHLDFDKNDFYLKTFEKDEVKR